MVQQYQYYLQRYERLVHEIFSRRAYGETCWGFWAERLEASKQSGDEEFSGTEKMETGPMSWPEGVIRGATWGTRSLRVDI